MRVPIDGSEQAITACEVLATIKEEGSRKVSMRLNAPESGNKQREGNAAAMLDGWKACTEEAPRPENRKDYRVCNNMRGNAFVVKDALVVSAVGRAVQVGGSREKNVSANANSKPRGSYSCRSRKSSRRQSRPFCLKAYSLIIVFEFCPLTEELPPWQNRVDSPRS